MTDEPMCDLLNEKIAEKNILLDKKQELEVRLDEINEQISDLEILIEQLKVIVGEE